MQPNRNVKLWKINKNIALKTNCSLGIEKKNKANEKKQEKGEAIMSVGRCEIMIFPESFFFY